MRLRKLLPLTLGSLLLPHLCTPAAGQVLKLVSLGPGGIQGDASSQRSRVSADGWTVAFSSSATNLVPGDTNGLPDVFVRELRTGVTRRVNVATGGGQSNGPVTRVAMSADGRHVLFESTASNLVPGDTSVSDVFSHDCVTGITVRISEAPGGVMGNGASGGPNSSADGRWAVFDSSSTNLVAVDTNFQRDIFVRDRDPDGNGVLDEGNATLVMLSKNKSGNQGKQGSWFPRISPSGRFVTFHSNAGNLVQGDTNKEWDVFLVDRDPDGNGIMDEGNGTIERVSVGDNDLEGIGHSRDGVVSADGRFVGFFSETTNLVPGDSNNQGDVFVHDRLLNRTTRLSDTPAGMSGNGESFVGDFADNGRLLIFRSDASDLVSGDTGQHRDLFLRNRDPDGNGIFDEPGDVTTRFSVTVNGQEADGSSDSGSISADGRFVVFQSLAENLVEGDTNQQLDVFRRDLMKLEMRGQQRAGQPVSFKLSSAEGQPGRRFQVVVSTSGTSPGTTPLAGTLLPLTFDRWTRWSLLLWRQLSGRVNGAGEGSTQVVLFPPLPPGTTLTCLGVTLDRATGAVLAWTAPLEITVQ